MDWNNINRDRDTSGLGPIEYDQSKVPSLIRKHADNVRTKTYGQEVREAQARNAEYAGLIASEAVDISNETKERQDTVETQFNSVQQELTDKDPISAPEIIAARNGEATLNIRLDKEHREVTAQLVKTMNKTKDIVTPEMFGATGGSDDSSAFQQAIDYLTSVGGGTLYVPQGLWRANFTVDSYITIEGDNVGTSIIKSVDNSNKDVIKGRGFDTLSLINTGVEHEGVRYFSLKNITIDGNKENNNLGYGIRVWGRSFNWDHVIVQQCCEDGILTEFSTHMSPREYNFRDQILESKFSNIKSVYNNKNGWTYNGPHDSLIDNYVAVRNVGWALYQREKWSSLFGYNWNSWLNGNGYHIGTRVIGDSIVGNSNYRSDVPNADTGVGIYFHNDSATSKLKGVRLSGYLKGIRSSGYNQTIDATLTDCGIGVEVDVLTGSRLDINAIQNDLAFKVINDNSNIINTTVLGSTELVEGVFNSSTYANIVNTGSESGTILQLSDRNIKSKGFTFKTPQNSGVLLTTLSNPTANERGGVILQTKFDDLTAAPTEDDFNRLLGKLRSAGVISNL